MDFLICQTSAASPAEPGELLFWFSDATHDRGVEITTTSARVSAVASLWTRWGQLGLGIVCLVMIANLQYGWTLFIDPIDAKHHWGRAAIQVAFTIFIVTETWTAPIVGYLVDRFGPRVLVLASGVLVASAWVINSIADSLSLIY